MNLDSFLNLKSVVCDSHHEQNAVDVVLSHNATRFNFHVNQMSQDTIVHNNIQMTIDFFRCS